ncbi:MAG: hypothetical protein ACYDG4_13245 [Desulfuromonadaceae bacterium]
MSIIFKPSGTLNVATDPSDLPEEKGSLLTGNQGGISSTAMQRCKNLRLDQEGVAKTRDGSAKLNATAISAPLSIIEQAGYRYSFGGANIYRNETSILAGMSSARWSAMLYNAFNDTTQDVFALNGVNRKKIEGTTVHEWGIDPPTVAAVLAADSTLNMLEGDYKAVYTYCRKVGLTVICESDPSPEVAAAVTLYNQGLDITWTASVDPQVTHVRIYRTLSDGDTYYHQEDVAIGTLTLKTNILDSALGGEVATNHDRPPQGTFVLGPTFNGTCFIIKDNLLYYCLPKQPEYWPLTYFIEVSPIQFPGKSLVFYNSSPYFLTKSEIYQIQGTGHGTFFPFPCKAITGAQGPQGAISVHGKGILHRGSDGVYLFNGSLDKKITQAEFDPIFRGETVNGVPGATNPVNDWLIQYGNKLYIGYTSAGYTYPTNVLVSNIDTGRTAYYSFGIQIPTVAVDYYNNRLLAGDSAGYIWALEVAGATTDGGTAIAWETQSKDFMLQTRAHFPRWVKYDVDATAATGVQGKLYLDGEVHHSHTITGNRDTTARLVKTGNGNRSSILISGTGPVKIYAVEGE